MTPDNDTVRRIAWSQVFPFVRLFGTFRLAINYTRLTLALVAIIGLYVGGRVLDAVWTTADGGVLVTSTVGGEYDLLDLDGRQLRFGRSGNLITEIQAFAAPAGDFDVWQQAAQRELETSRANVRGITREQREALAERRAAIEPLLDARLEEIDADEGAAVAQRSRQRGAAFAAADVMRYLLSDELVDMPPLPDGLTLRDLPELTPEDKTADFQAAVQTAQKLRRAELLEPRGPFIALWSFTERCVAGAVRGVATGNLGLAGGAFSVEPSLFGSLGTALRGLVWVVTERPVFALLGGLWHLALLALFGGAVARHAAVQVTRDEALGLGPALSFGLTKWRELVVGPLLPLGVVLAGGLIMLIGGVVLGLISQIPVIGGLALVIEGLLYGLALLGGFVLALVLIGYVLGLHLMTPVIAVESSDAFDAITRSFGYIGQRLWNAAFYALLLLAYGGLCFLMVRAIAVLLFKVTHTFTAAGFSWFGAWTSGQTDTISKFDVMWQMPAWSELSLLPTVDGPPFWGSFFNGPVDTGEWLGAALIALWVFLGVSLVGAFILSFYFSGCTQIYLLLRRDVDATDWDEIYFEEEEDLLGPAPEAAGAPLPVVGATEGGGATVAPQAPAGDTSTTSDTPAAEAPETQAPAEDGSGDETPDADKPPS